MSDARTVLASVPLHRLRFGENDLYLSQASIDAILAALAEAGLVIVPRVPTLKMCKAGEAVPDMRLTSHVWKAMVEAANEQ